MVSLLAYAYDAVSHSRRTAHTVNARYGRHDNDVLSAREQGADGREAKLVDVLIDGEVFLYVCVRRRQVGFWLVIVIVRNIVFHGVVREESFHLLVQLGGKRLVVAEDKGGASDVGDDISHRERLSRTCHTEQHLCLVALTDSPPVRLLMACGWSPVGANLDVILKSISDKWLWSCLRKSKRAPMIGKNTKSL